MIASLPPVPPAAPPEGDAWLRWLQRCLLLAVGYGAVALGCRWVWPDGLAWLPAAVALVALARFGLRCWPAIPAAALLLAAAAPASAQALLPWAAGDLAGALLGAALVRRANCSTRLVGSADLLPVLAAIVLAVVGGAVGRLAWTLAAGQPTSSGAAAAALAQRALGLALLAPAGFALQPRALCAAFATRRRRKVNASLLGAFLASMVALAWLPPAQPAAGAALAALAAGLLAALVASAGLTAGAAALLPAALGLAWAAGGDSGLFAGQPVAAGWFGALLGAVQLLAHALRGDGSVDHRWIDALAGLGIGVAQWRVGSDRGRTSVRWRELAAQDSASFADWLARVHADDRPALQVALARLIDGSDAHALQALRVRAGDGWRWLDLQWLAIERGLLGRATRLLAAAADARARRDAQDRQHLWASLFQNAQEGLLITDGQLRVLDANPAFTQILGSPREELLGTVPAILDTAPADPLARQQRLLMRSALRSGAPWRGEIVEPRGDGQPCTLQTTISTVAAEDGSVRYHLVVVSDVTEQRRQRDQLERQAHCDELTRLPNRSRLMELLAQSMRAADQDGHLLAVCYLDLDRFKPVNDRFGHAAGDRLLVELAGRLRGALRSTDFWSDAVGRIGGDEFVLLLRAASTDEVERALERLLRLVAQPYVLDASVDAVQVTASIGATVYPEDRSDADTLLRHADHAMYDAKLAGRNGYQLFDPENRRRHEAQVMAVGRAQEALDNGEFVLYYQPKVDMRRGVVLGLEALLRWDDPQRGLIAPAQFLPQIENTGLLARIGDWALAQAIEHLAGWRRAQLALAVSVNVAARHLQEPDFALRLAELLARHGDDALAGAVELEVLETAAYVDIEATSAKLAQCRTLGVRIALDDFGTGYSTLSYLKQLPVDVLKIDRSFVHHMLDSNQDRAIVEGVIGLARTFQCAVIAEGVESPAQARALLDMGCHIGQGTGIAAPMPAAAVASWVREYRGLFALGVAGAAPRSSAAGAAE